MGARILLPEKCAILQCEENLVAGSSPLLPGAVKHPISHPEELTLNFHILFNGGDCCVLPEDAREKNGTSLMNGTMVEEGMDLNMMIK